MHFGYTVLPAFTISLAKKTGQETPDAKAYEEFRYESEPTRTHFVRSRRETGRLEKAGWLDQGPRMTSEKDSVAWKQEEELET